MKTLYVKTRVQWRDWLAKHHATESEIWLVYYRKASGKPRVSYNDAVEEALCFGWIDSQQKSLDKERFAQRFSPRRNTSVWSEPNKQRARKLIRQKLMTPAGLDLAKEALKKLPWEIASDILDALRADKAVWQNWQKFPLAYRKMRVAWIDGARSRPEEFQKRLGYLIKMTKQNKRFGMVQ